jgi:hypothetical protein
VSHSNRAVSKTASADGRASHIVLSWTSAPHVWVISDPALSMCEHTLIVTVSAIGHDLLKHK